MRYSTPLAIIALTSLAIIGTTASALPSTPPVGSSGYTGGVFSRYFQNIIETAPNGGSCPTGQSIIGFNTTKNSSYGTPICGVVGSDGAALYLTGNLRGTANYIPKYGATNTGILNSQIFDNGTNVGIGTSSPTSKLDVNGDIRVNGLTVGRGAGNGNTNTVVGINALPINTSGYYNTAVGTDALSSNINGSNNTAIGKQALQNNTSGYLNVAIGDRTLSSNTIAWGNTAMGQQTLESITGPSQYNTAIGDQSLRWITLGNYNTSLGSKAGNNLSSGDYNISIGANSTLPSTTASNQLSIGNWIYGQGGNIGIGTGTALSARLTVAGQVQITGGTPGVGKVLTSNANGLASWSQQWTNTGSNLLYTNSHVVGIGLMPNYFWNYSLGQLPDSLQTAMNKPLRVGGGGILLGQANNFTNQGFSLAGVSLNYGSTGGTSVAPFAMITGKSFVNYNEVGIGGGHDGGGQGDSNPQAIVFYTNPVPYQANVENERMRIDANGNVGIGTGTALTARLTVAGQVQITGGTPGVGKVLTSDANGLASWTTPSGGGTQVCTGTGANNTCYGTSALGLNTSGANNTAIGNQSLRANTLGLNNTAIGNQSLYSNTSGGGNSAMGNSSLFMNTTGQSNTAQGTHSLTANTSGSSNSAVGAQALSSNTSGWNNSAVGASALFSTTTGQNNVALGYMAGQNNTIGNNNIAIGASTNFASATASNQLNIGNWIYGSGGYIGIGISVPGKTLDVAGSIRFSSGHLISNSPNGALVINAGGASSSAGGIYFRGDTTIGDESAYTDWMLINKYGNIGIGTISPDSGIGVNRFVEISGPTHAGLTLTDTDTPTAKINMWNDGGNFRLYQNNTSNYILSANTAGAVGIGTTSQSQKLHVEGNETIRSTSPTVFFRDTDNRSAMIHTNSNQFYILRGCGTDSESWCPYGSYWPLQIDLESNFATFGGNVRITGYTYGKPQCYRKDGPITNVSTVTCDAGTYMLNGGGKCYQYSGDNSDVSFLNESFPSGVNSWQADCHGWSGNNANGWSSSYAAQAFAICCYN